MSKLFSISYICLLVLFVIFSYLFVDINLIYLKNLYSGFALSNRVVVAIGYTVFIALFVWFQYKILKTIEHNNLNFSNLKKIILISGILLLLSYPTIISYDIFNYMNTAKVAYEYHENPYIVMPIDISNNAYNLFTRAANKTALYGPVWIGLTALPHYLGFGNFIASMILFKVLVAVFYGGVCYLLWKLSKDSYVVAFFALNPLVLLETFISGHNDVVMMFLVLLSLYCFTKKKIMVALLFFLASILVKYASIILLPVIIYLMLVLYRNKKIDWMQVYMYSFILMGIVFLLSPLREEMYPWYFIWVIPFAGLVKRKKIQILVYVFSFGLMLGYIPYMLFGSYIGISAIIRIILMVLPLLITTFVLFWRKK